MNSSCYQVRWMDSSGKRYARDFGETAFDLALAEFLKRNRDPKLDRVELIMDAQGEFMDLSEKRKLIFAEIQRYQDEEYTGEAALRGEQ